MSSKKTLSKRHKVIDISIGTRDYFYPHESSMTNENTGRGSVLGPAPYPNKSNGKLDRFASSEFMLIEND